MMEEVGYIAKALARQHRENPSQEDDETNLVQGAKHSRLGTHRRRTIVEENQGETAEEEAPASSSNVPSETPTGGEIPEETPSRWRNILRRRIEQLWRRWRDALYGGHSNRSISVREGEAFGCSLHGYPGDGGGNADRTTVNCPDDFRNWGGRWGEDDSSAQLVMQNQWDNILRHVMGITAAMEVWDPSTSSSSTTGVAPTPGDNNTNASALDGNDEGDDHPDPRGGSASVQPDNTERK